MIVKLTKRTRDQFKNQNHNLSFLTDFFIDD